MTLAEGPNGRNTVTAATRFVKYLLVKTDGLTLCAADVGFTAMACTQTDALRTTRPRSPTTPPTEPPKPDA